MKTALEKRLDEILGCEDRIAHADLAALIRGGASAREAIDVCVENASIRAWARMSARVNGLASAKGV